MHASGRLAVIDLGSNSFRLVVFSAANGWWQRTDEIYQVVRIGEGMAATGRLGEEPMRARTGDALDVFAAHFCEAAGLLDQPPYAPSAPDVSPVELTPAPSAPPAGITPAPSAPPTALTASAGHGPSASEGTRSTRGGDERDPRR